MNRRFGMEFEFLTHSVSISDMKSILQEAVQLYDPKREVSNKESLRFWTIKEEYCGMEITTPILELSNESLDKIKNILGFISQKCTGHNIINYNCGVHVHVDINEFTVGQVRCLCKVFNLYEKALFKIQPNSRTNNSYCAPLNKPNSWFDDFDPNQIIPHQYFMFDHSTSVNFNEFDNKGTVEIRHCAGTSNPKKAIGWLITVLSLIEISKNLESFEETCGENISNLCNFIYNNNTNNDILEEHKDSCLNWINQRYRKIRNI